MTDRRERQLVADMVRAEYPRECRVGYGPLASTPVVLAEDIDRWVWAQSDGSKGRIANSMSVAVAHLFEHTLEYAPPMYESFWVEGALHSEENDEGLKGFYRNGVMVEAKRVEEGGWLCLAWPWLFNRFGLNAPLLGISWHVLDDGKVHVFDRPEALEDGTPISAFQWAMLRTPWTVQTRLKDVPGRPGAVMLNESDPEATTAVFGAAFVIATCAFALCRNVPREPVVTPPKVARKRAASLGLSEPLESVSRITLPGSARSASGSRLGAAVGQQELPAHLVRAHPKTYRRRDDGSGGLGKHHAEGTWLWAPQARGNPERGSRVPEVTVKPVDEQ